MKMAKNITISLDKAIDKQQIISAIIQILNINEMDIYFFYSHENLISVNNIDVFVDYIPLENSELKANINISITEHLSYKFEFFDIDFPTNLAKVLNTNIFIPAPMSFNYSIIRIEPTGKLYGANEYETDDEFEYLDDIKLLNKNTIKTLINTIKADAIEEELIAQETGI